MRRLAATLAACLWLCFAAAASAATLVASYTPGANRNNTTDYAGMVFTPTGSNIVVNTMGLRCATGNTGLQPVILSNTGGTVLASVVVNLTGCTVGTFYYVALASPVTLNTGTAYQLTASEANAGYNFADTGAVTLNGAGSVSSIFGTSLASMTTQAANQSYVGVDLNGVAQAQANFTILNSGDSTDGVLYGPPLAWFSNDTNTGGARSVLGLSKGFVYFECNMLFALANHSGCGISEASIAFATLGNLGTSGSMMFTAGGIYVNGSLKSSAIGTTTGNLAGVAVDITNGYIWFTVDGVHWNSTSVANTPTINNTGGGGIALTGLTGPYYAAVTGQSTQTQAVVNLGQSSFAYTVPAGFNAGFSLPTAGGLGLLGVGE